jgi:hypothetical protein
MSDVLVEVPPTEMLEEVRLYRRTAPQVDSIIFIIIIILMTTLN